MSALEQLVSAGFIRCARAMRASGLQALDLMTQDAQDLDTCSCPVERQKWSTILKVSTSTRQGCNLATNCAAGNTAQVQKGRVRVIGVVSCCWSGLRPHCSSLFRDPVGCLSACQQGFCIAAGQIRPQRVHQCMIAAACSMSTLSSIRAYLWRQAEP